MNDRSATRPREILVFEIEARRFGFSVDVVRELLRVVTIVPLPQPKGSIPIEGIINLRGSIVPVPDLRAILGLPPKPAEPSDHLVVVESDDHLVAFRVDRAVELAGLSETDLDPSKTGVIDDTDRVFEVAKFADGLIPLIDVRSIVSTCYLANRKPNGSAISATGSIASAANASQSVPTHAEVGAVGASPRRPDEDLHGISNGGDS